MYGDTLNLSATVADPFTDCVGVSYYADTNGDGILDSGDTLLATATSASNNWAASVVTTNVLPVGVNTIFAQPSFGSSTVAAGNYVASQVTVSSPCLTVPGATAGSTNVEFTFTGGSATADEHIGYYLVDDSDGDITVDSQSVSPVDPGYLAQAERGCSPCSRPEPPSAARLQ